MNADELAVWVRIFRKLGTRAQKAAARLAGTPEGRRELGRGAAGDTTVVLDRVLEDIVIRELKTRGNVRLVSEELGVADFGNPQCCVVADPLDGSVNAKWGMGVYAVSYALAPPIPTLGNIRVGYIRNLLSGEEYWAIRGRGAFRDGNKIFTQNDGRLRALLVELSPEQDRAIANLRRPISAAPRVRSFGSMALDLAYVAQGSASAVMDMRGGLLRALDVCAGKLIVEEAGGVVTGADGKSIEGTVVDIYNRGDLLAAGNRTIHKKLARMVA